MSKIFYPSSEKLKFLLDSIHNREIALPDFQRDFVWYPADTEMLVESICQNFPAGSLLRIRNTDTVYFAPREFASAPLLEGHKPHYLILDGQQRLTSLYHAFYGTGAYRYFINLQILLDGQDLEDAVFFLRRPDASKQYGTIQQQANALVFPFEGLFGDHTGFEGWLDDILEHRPDATEDKKALKSQLRELDKLWLINVRDYEFPMVTLDDKTSPEAVCTIFETLNRTGIKLSVFDLLVARFWPKDVRLRDLWDQALVDYPIIKDFNIDPYYILQAISILTSRNNSGKRADVLKMTVEQIPKGWDPVVKGLAAFLQLLRDDCGIIQPRWLPYNTMLITGAAVLAAISDLKGLAVGAARNKIQRWFWCSVFSQAYDKAANTQTTKDYVELLKWIHGGEPPQAVATFQFDKRLLREIRSKQSAVYLGVFALTLRNSARDLYSGVPITASLMADKSIDDHHVFPWAYLEEHYPFLSLTLRDCILNHALIDKDTNIRISKRAPSDYFTEIATKLGEDQLTAALHSHLLPSTSDSPLWSDDFQAFLDAREQLVLDEINKVTQ